MINILKISKLSKNKIKTKYGSDEGKTYTICNIDKFDNENGLREFINKLFKLFYFL